MTLGMGQAWLDRAADAVGEGSAAVSVEQVVALMAQGRALPINLKEARVLVLVLVTTNLTKVPVHHFLISSRGCLHLTLTPYTSTSPPLKLFPSHTNTPRCSSARDPGRRRWRSWASAARCTACAPPRTTPPGMATGHGGRAPLPHAHCIMQH